MDWLHVLNTHLDKCARSGELSQFKLLTNNYARAEFILKNEKSFEIDRYLVNHVNGASDDKCSTRSNEARANGNAFFSQRTQNKKAFTYYTRALMTAPVTANGTLKENKALVLAYSNRSAVFYEEQMFEECLVDIEQCTAYLLRYHDVDEADWLFNLVLKLATRQKNCYFKMQRMNSLKTFAGCELYQVLECSIFSEEKYTAKRNGLMAELKEQQEALMTKEIKDDLMKPKAEDSATLGYMAQDCVIVEFTKEKGRHCLASRDIETGECLFVEEPYSAILLPEFASDYCQTCFKSVHDPATQLYRHNLNIEFCPHCTNVVFCSSKCRRTNQFHAFECQVLESLLHNVGVGHLAYRIVASTEPHVIEKYAQVERTQSFKANTMDIEYGKFSRERDYEQVFYLMTHEDETHVEDLFQYSLTAVLLAKHFNKVSECGQSVDINSVACLILRHLLQTICNAHAITKLRDVLTSDNASTMEREQIRYATAMYPRVSLLNHSCNSNVLSSYREDSAVIVVKSGRPIEANAEIFNCYGPHYLKMNLADRQQQLFGQYHFRCQCDKCIDQSREYRVNREVSFDFGSVLKCLNCKKYPTEVQVKLGRLSHIQCSQCLKDTAIEAYATEFEKYHSELISMNLSNQKLMNENMSAIKNLLTKYTSLMFIDKSGLQIDQANFNASKAGIIEPFKYWYMDFTKLVDAMSHLSCILGDCPTAADILQSNIKNLEFLYGMDGVANKRTGGDAVLMEHVEFAHEFQKLAEVQGNCGQFREALASAEKAILIANKFYPEDNQVLRELHELRANIKNVL